CSASPRSGPVKSARKRATATPASATSPASQQGALSMSGGSFDEGFSNRFWCEIAGGSPFHRSLPAPEPQGGEEVLKLKRVRYGHGFPGGIAQKLWQPDDQSLL